MPKSNSKGRESQPKAASFSPTPRTLSSLCKSFALLTIFPLAAKPKAKLDKKTAAKAKLEQCRGKLQQRLRKHPIDPGQPVDPVSPLYTPEDINDFLNWQGQHHLSDVDEDRQMRLFTLHRRSKRQMRKRARKRMAEMPGLLLKSKRCEELRRKCGGMKHFWEVLDLEQNLVQYRSRWPAREGESFTVVHDFGGDSPGT